MKTFILALVSIGFIGSVSYAAEGSRATDFTYDLGLSSGNSGTGSYTEINLGLNWFAKEWLAWRNAAFGRFQTDVQTAYGLDSSVRLVGEFGSARNGLTTFAGPGYRIASGTPTAPFAEEGLVVHMGGLSLGAGAKQIFDSWIHQGYGNDNQYFLILGGGGAF
jgi:hypothetical protein